MPKFFFITSIRHAEMCVIPLRKAVIKGFISFMYTKESEHFMGTLWPKTENKADFVLTDQSM